MLYQNGGQFERLIDNDTRMGPRIGSKEDIHEFLKMNGYDYVRSVIIDDIFIFKV